MPCAAGGELDWQDGAEGIFRCARDVRGGCLFCECSGHTDLEISVHDALLMQILQRACNLLEDYSRVLLSVAATRQNFVKERAARDELHTEDNFALRLFIRTWRRGTDGECDELGG